MLKASIDTEAVVRRSTVKKLPLKIFQSSMENICAESLFNKVAGLQPTPSPTQTFSDTGVFWLNQNTKNFILAKQEDVTVFEV